MRRRGWSDNTSDGDQIIQSAESKTSATRGVILISAAAPSFALRFIDRIETTAAQSTQSYEKLQHQKQQVAFTLETKTYR